MVVNDIEEDRQSLLVTGIDEAFEFLGSSVSVLYGEGKDQFRAPGNCATGISSTAVTPSSLSSGRQGMIASKVPAWLKVPTWSS
jgi:hypothetical protein